VLLLSLKSLGLVLQPQRQQRGGRFPTFQVLFRTELVTSIKKTTDMRKLVFLFLLFTASIVVRSQTAPPTPPVPISLEQSLILNVNDPAKDFTVQMINGETITLSDLRGQVVLLSFGATWCPPCIRKLYAFPSMIIEPFENSPFVLLPILMNNMETVKEKMAELRENGVNINVGIDPNRSIFSLYAHIRAGIPKDFLIDQNGVIRYVSRGFSEEGMNELATMIQKLLDEQKPLQEKIEDLTVEYGNESEVESRFKNSRIMHFFAFLLCLCIFEVLRRLRKKRHKNKFNNIQQNL